MRLTRAALLVLAGLLCGCAYLTRQGTILYLAIDSGFSAKEIELQLEKSFLEKYKNRVTIDAIFTVDRSMKGPLLPNLDGDLHFAGRTPQAKMVTVAEVANAALFPKATELVRLADSTKRAIHVVGVWRLWPEHSGSSKEVQGRPIEALASYKPAHAFEIHPVTRINGFRLEESFVPVKGFSPGAAAATFDIYENTVCKLLIKPTSIGIVTRKGLYNDVEFIMEITGDRPLIVADGRFVTASALDMDGNVVAKNIRMVFARNTPPERAVRSLHRGGRLHVFGIPRINFAEVLRRVQASAADSTQLRLSIPYEIVVIGVFTDGTGPK